MKGRENGRGKGARHCVGQQIRSSSRTIRVSVVQIAETSECIVRAKQRSINVNDAQINGGTNVVLVSRGCVCVCVCRYSWCFVRLLVNLSVALLGWVLLKRWSGWCGAALRQLIQVSCKIVVVVCLF
jgi:hypothetical protein